MEQNFYPDLYKVKSKMESQKTYKKGKEINVTVEAENLENHAPAQARARFSREQPVHSMIKHEPQRYTEFIEF